MRAGKSPSGLASSASSPQSEEPFCAGFAMEKVADGKATKLIVPSDMQNLAATVSAIKEISGEVTE